MPSVMGQVPEYETREAMVYCNFNSREWLGLQYTERAQAVAQYRIHHLIEAHVHDAYEKAAKRKEMQQ